MAYNLEYLDDMAATKLMTAAEEVAIGGEEEEETTTRYEDIPYPLPLVNGRAIFKCKYCDRVLSQISNLRSHLLTHTGDKPFKCSTCSCSFRDSVALRKHSASHKGTPLIITI